MPEMTNENEKPKKKTTTKSGTTKNKATVKASATKKSTTTKKAKTASTTKKATSKTASTTKKTTPKKKTTSAKSKETTATKAVKEARKKVANEVKEDLKNKSKKTETKKSKVQAEKAELKEETIIQKIKNFIAKIVAMQEEAENKKALAESLKEDKKNDVQDVLANKTKYMLEYYDLPYRYNETVVKILAQTPKRLFVYWDISDTDRNKYQKVFGKNFFEETYPVLLVHNEEKNYTFEVPINDFANSWYLDIEDPKSKYVIQLGRKFRTKPEYVNIASTEEASSVELLNDYVPITTSNVLEVPNDHILFESIKEKALYRNVKTNEESYIDIANSDFMKKIGKIYSVYDLYKEIYKNELGDGSLTDLLNPSSMSSSMFR